MSVKFTREAADRTRRAVLEVERRAAPLPGIVRGRTRRRLDDGEGTAIYLAVILSGGPGQDYKADIYSDYGKTPKVKYAENVDLKIMQIDAAETVSAGTIYPAYEIIWNETSYWTAYAPVIR